MTHPLASILAAANGFVLIGDSSQDRFPGFSYHAYTTAKKPFYCIDLGGLTESRGPTKGGKVYAPNDELPADHDDLAIIWVKPSRATEAVELAHRHGCKRVWFSFHSGHPDAIARAGQLGMDVVEVGRCPIYYLEGAPLVCKLHAGLVKLSGTAGRPQQRTLDRGQRIMV